MRIVAESPGRGGSTSLLGTAAPPVTPADHVRWSRFLAATEAEGPGVRAALWLQGCAVHCPGCFNPQLWAPRGGALTPTAVTARAWVDQARAAGAAGVTLLGGEPFDQAGAAAAVAEAFRDAGMTVMTFSGYPLERLIAWSAEREDVARLLAATDLLCDGPYLQALPDPHRPWIGSRNQGIRALTDAHADDVRVIAAHGGADTLEIRIARDGSVGVNGWATDAALAALLDDLGVRADRPEDVRARQASPEADRAQQPKAEVVR